MDISRKLTQEMLINTYVCLSLETGSIGESVAGDYGCFKVNHLLLLLWLLLSIL